MSKKDKAVKLENELNAEQIVEEVKVPKQLPSTKKCLQQIAKVVRRMDNTLTDLNKVKFEVDELFTKFNPDDVAPKDEARMREMLEVVQASTSILWYLTKRMARKYVNKDIADLSDYKRKALKR
jgi:hypothetical protein